MTDNVERRKLALETIRRNITRSGLYIYVVGGPPLPRYAYTIGTSERLGAELILAGASFYGKDEVAEIITGLVFPLGASSDWKSLHLSIDSHGSFSFREVDRTWTNELMLGALDYYGANDVPAFQIVPDQAHWTIDVPILSAPWSAITEPVWQWMHEPWQYPVPAKSIGVTNLRALRGERITEATRWEEDNWELFAGSGPDTPADEMRPVSLGTLLAVDDSLKAVVDLPVERGLWRDGDSDWHPWG